MTTTSSSTTPASTATSSARSSLFPTTELLSLAAFGLVSYAVTSWERRRITKEQKHPSRITAHQQPFLPPQNLVQYLHKHKKWRHYNEDHEHFVRECPKVELHVHLDGALDPDFLWHCMEQYSDLLMCLPVSTHLPWDAKRPLPVRKLVEDCETVDDFHDLCTCRRGQRSLQNMLTCFEIFLPLVRGAPLKLIEELAHDFCRRQWEQHVVYTEVRYNPHLMMKDKHSKASGSFDMGDADEPEGSEVTKQEERKQAARDIVHAVMRGLRRGCKEYDIVVNQILCAINWRPDWAMDVLDLAQEFKDEHPCGVVGIDIAAGEEHFDERQFPHLYKRHFEMMQKAQDLNIPISIHAGETPDGIHNVKRAVATKNHKEPGYGAKRIGHGYRMADSPELMEQLAKDKIHVEICPTSSVETGGWMFEHLDYDFVDGSSTASIGVGTDHSVSSVNKDITSFKPRMKPWKDHPGMKMIRNGVSISLNSDDPAVFHTSLTWQYRIALAKMGLTKEQVAQSNIDAIVASFGRPDEKNKLRALLEDFYASLSRGELNNNGLSDTKRFSDRVRGIR